MKRIGDFCARKSVLQLLCVWGFVVPAGLSAQSAINFATDGSISGCAADFNGTGHMVCLELGNENATGVSWVTPGTPGATAGNPGVEGQGTINAPLSLGSLVQPANGSSNFRSASCAPSAYGAGTINCITMALQIIRQPPPTNCGRPGQPSCPPPVITTDTLLQGVAFYPPGGTNSGLRSLGVFSGTTSAPGCAMTKLGNGQEICAIVANGQMEGIAFNPASTTTAMTTTAGPNSTGFVSLPFGSNFTGAPSCTIGNKGGTINNGNTVAICAAVQNGELVGFAFDPRSGFNSTSTPMPLISGPFSGNPSCATSQNNAATGAAGTSPQVICSIIVGSGSSSTLQAIAFDPIGGTKTAPQNFGSGPSGSTWTGGIGCSFNNDHSPNTNITFQTLTHSNEVVCAAVARESTGDVVFGISLDPRAIPASRTGFTSVTLPSNALGGTLSSPSCLSLFVDTDQISCGAAFASSASSAEIGFTVPL